MKVRANNLKVFIMNAMVCSKVHNIKIRYSDTFSGNYCYMVINYLWRFKSCQGTGKLFYISHRTFSSISKINFTRRVLLICFRFDIRMYICAYFYYIIFSTNIFYYYLISDKTYFSYNFYF